MVNTGVEVGEAWCGLCLPKRSECLSETCGEYLSEYCGVFCCGFLFLLSLCMESSGEYCGEFCGGFSSRLPCRGMGAQMLSPSCSRSRVAHSCWPPRHNPIESRLPLFPADTCFCKNSITKNVKARTRKSTKELTLPRVVTESCTSIIIMSDPTRRHPRPARILRCSLAPAARPSDNHWPSPTSHVVSVHSPTSPN